MQLSDYDYDLPDNLIARYPLAERTASRLLEVNADEQAIRDGLFRELPDLLREGDLLVLNDTRVIHARLAALKETGGKAEILIERVLDEVTALAHVRASKSPKPGSCLLLAADATAKVIERRGEFFLLRFSLALMPFLDEHGEVPLPPYLHREAESADDRRYQTVYARESGAVAAPTAGLHFDDAMLQTLADKGVRHTCVTLHVGAGTFQALRPENIEARRLHEERVVVTPATCEQVLQTRRAGGRVVAVGTTAVRALETAAAAGEIAPYDGETDLFIMPGYEFRCVDLMLTNFHLPRSSLLMLVSAFAGRELVLRAYRHAVKQQYRFFSYGDAMLVSPAGHV
jgi:S-adenosylmethionine:tRNA ribosyltransferase-isomerase